jgi:beta-lactamase regulating signal transducer with metallopeptidase domain
MNSTAFLLALGRLSLEASVLILLVLAAQRIFRKHLSPQWSCALWLLVAIGLLPISVASRVSLFNFVPGWNSRAPGNPGWEVVGDQVPTMIEPAGEVRVAAMPPPGIGASETSRPESNAGNAYRSQAGARPRVDWGGWGFRGWLTGVVLLGGYVAVRTLALNRRLGRLPELNDPAVSRLLADCCRRMGVRRAPVVCEGRHVAAPALHGLLRPRLLLPAGFLARYSEEELRFIFLHELAHLRRRDIAFNWLATALQVVHWFNPLVWFAFARWRVDREIACDAMAVEAAGSSRHIAYGRTLLRLLEDFSVQAAHPALAGVLESRQALRRRMTMIAGYRPAGRPWLAAVLLGMLAIVGLTDAKVAPDLVAPAVVVPVDIVAPRGPRVAVVPEGDGSMPVQAVKETDRARAPSPAQRETQETKTVAEEPREPAPQSEKPNPETTLVVEGAAGASRGLPVEKIVLTPAPSQEHETVSEVRTGANAAAQEPPDQRMAAATAPMASVPSDQRASGRLPNLPNTGGLPVAPAGSAGAPTHIAFVVDTSGSMRDPRLGGLWPIILDQVDEVLAAHPGLVGVQLLDAHGQYILGRSSGWRPNTPAARGEIARSLRRYGIDNYSNPIPGIYRVFRELRDAQDPNMKLAIYVFGDEFNSGDSAEKVIEQLDRLNPADAKGKRQVVIHAIGFPTMFRSPAVPGNTAIRFINLMDTITREHGGTFVMLPSL